MITYQHLAYLFKDKKIEPFLVIAPYSEEEQDKPISLSVHEGQEYDYILSGSLKVVIDGKVKVFTKGDSIIYDSGAPHGMIATGGEKCEFLAILIK
ncbi:MAG: cupin domain-containing protein [Oscillospiraceae bacterium]|nr:cupin domain-containing protein [Oscillospiraceae bacterium]